MPTSDQRPSSPFDSSDDASPPAGAPTWSSIASMPSLAPLPGVTMWPTTGERIMLNFVRLEPGAIVPMHHHHHEQARTVLEGSIVLTIEGETRELGPGDAYIAPANARHGATSPNGCLVVDVFSPPREDYSIPADPAKES